MAKNSSQVTIAWYGGLELLHAIPELRVTPKNFSCCVKRSPKSESEDFTSSKSAVAGLITYHALSSAGMAVALPHRSMLQPGAAETMGFCMATFECRCSSTCWGDSLVLVGSSDSTGAWQPHRGVKLITDEQTFPVWRARNVPIAAGEPAVLQCKLVILRANGKAEWEPLDRNRELPLLAGRVLSLQLEWGVPSSSRPSEVSPPRPTLLAMPPVPPPLRPPSGPLSAPAAAQVVHVNVGGGGGGAGGAALPGSGGRVSVGAAWGDRGCSMASGGACAGSSAPVDPPPLILPPMVLGFHPVRDRLDTIMSMDLSWPPSPLSSSVSSDMGKIASELSLRSLEGRPSEPSLRSLAEGDSHEGLQ
jgi:hypothetical protein